MEHLSEKIKIIAKNQGYSLAKLEKELKIGNDSIAKWGQSMSPSIAKVEAVASFLYVSISDLIDNRVNISQIIKRKHIEDIIKRLDGLSNEDIEFIRVLLDRLEAKNKPRQPILIFIYMDSLIGILFFITNDSFVGTQVLFFKFLFFIFLENEILFFGFLDWHTLESYFLESFPVPYWNLIKSKSYFWNKNRPPCWRSYSLC